MKRKILYLLTALAIAVGLSGIGAPIASANVYTSLTTCANSNAKWICMDVSAGTVTIKGAGALQTYGAGFSGNTPTKGWVAYDVYECNADASLATSFVIGSNNGNLPNSVVFDVDGAVFPGKVTVAPGVRDIIAWLANSQTGFLCIIVP